MLNFVSIFTKSLSKASAKQEFHFMRDAPDMHSSNKTWTTGSLKTPGFHVLDTLEINSKFFWINQLINKGRVKKMWIYPHLDGWVCQDGDKIHKKNMPLKSILDHFKSLYTNFFLPF